MKKFTMKLQRKSTHSYGLTIPKELVREFKWRERQKLDLIADNKKQQILIRDWKK